MMVLWLILLWGAIVGLALEINKRAWGWMGYDIALIVWCSLWLTFVSFRAGYRSER